MKFRGLNGDNNFVLRPTEVSVDIFHNHCLQPFFSWNISAYHLLNKNEVVLIPIYHMSSMIFQIMVFPEKLLILLACLLWQIVCFTFTLLVFQADLWVGSNVSRWAIEAQLISEGKLETCDSFYYETHPLYAVAMIKYNLNLRDYSCPLIGHLSGNNNSISGIIGLCGFVREKE